MRYFDVYCETVSGRFLDEFTIEAETVEEAYGIVYERYNWQPIHVELEEAEKPYEALQNAYFEGKHPLEAFPSIFTKGVTMTMICILFAIDLITEHDLW